MSTPKYTLQTPTLSDSPSIATVLMSAWHTNIHWVNGWDHPTLNQMIAWSAERTPFQLTSNRDTKRHQIAVSTSTGEIVGYARWELPPDLAAQNVWLEAKVTDVGDEERGELEERFKSSGSKEGMPKRANKEMLEYRSIPLDAAMARMEKQGPFMTLENMAVAPAFQRQGIATMLLRSALHKADQYGVRTHCMATPVGLKIYEKAGFEIVETVSTDYSHFEGGVAEPYVYHLMVREVGGGGK